MEALGIQVRVGKNELPWGLVWWQRLEVEAPEKVFQSLPSPHKPRLLNQLLAPPRPPFPPLALLPPLPPLPTLPPLPPLPPLLLSPRAREISWRQQIQPPGSRRPDQQLGRSQAHILSGYPKTTTATMTTAAIIAALESKCCMQLSGEGSGCSGRSGHHVFPPSHPQIFNNQFYQQRCPYRRCCCGRARWRICGSVWAVTMGWRVSGGDPQVFRFICFYSSLCSRVFPRS